MKPFDFLNEINYGKNNLIQQSDNPDLAEKIYSPFLVNRGLSYFADTILFANEMNIHHQCDNKLQYEFLLNTVRKKRRFSKWFKPEMSGDLDAVKNYYGYSNEKARMALRVLSPRDLAEIKRKCFKGGENHI